MPSRYLKSGWSPERREKQRLAIQRWKPWEKSTGPKTAIGKRQSATNGRWGFLKQLPAQDLLRLIKRI